MINPELFLSMFKNKKQVLISIQKDFDVCKSNQDSFEKLATLLEDGKNVSNEKVLKSVSKSLRYLNELNSKLLLLLLIYVSGRSYDSDLTHMLAKLGEGEAAIKELFKRKMRS